jgi:hypothetical protein
VSMDKEQKPQFVDEWTGGDQFENAIRRFGVVNACEWFGHRPDSEFTKDTIRVLDERLTENRKQP